MPPSLPNTRNFVSPSCQVLRQSPQNVKALFRKTQALVSRRDFDEAEAVARLGLQAEPGNRCGLTNPVLFFFALGFLPCLVVH